MEVINRVMAYLNKNGDALYQDSDDQPSEAERNQAKQDLEDAEYDRRLFIENRELRRLLSADEYNQQLESLSDLVQEASYRLRNAPTRRI